MTESPGTGAIPRDLAELPRDLAERLSANWRADLAGIKEAVIELANADARLADRVEKLIAFVKSLPAGEPQ